MGYQVYWTPADDVSKEAFNAFTEVIRKNKEKLLENSRHLSVCSDSIWFNMDEDPDVEFNLSRVKTKQSPTECQPNDCEWAQDVGNTLILALEFGIVTDIKGDDEQFLSDLETVHRIYPLKKQDEIKAMLEARIKEECVSQDSDEEEEKKPKDTFDWNRI